MAKFSLTIIVLLYVAAGINHFVNPSFYLQIMPPQLPFPLTLVYISGFAEIVLGIFLAFNKTQNAAAWGLIILLLLIFPANIQMVVNYFNNKNPNLWIAIVRLPLQIFLIWWAYTFTDKFRYRKAGYIKNI